MEAILRSSNAAAAADDDVATNSRRYERMNK
jgi:hypothetical protein